MKVKSLILSFEPSGSPDVTGYRLYMEEAPAEVNYDSQSWDIGSTTSIDISVLDGMTTKNGTYNLGISAVDGAGNESSMSKLEGVILDFEAPDPPGVISIERS